MLKKIGFEEHRVTGTGLLKLKADELCKAGLPFLIANELENILEELSTKTFYIQDYNDEGELLEEFGKYTMRNDDDLHRFLRTVDGKGLVSMNDSNEDPDIITSLKEIY